MILHREQQHIGFQRWLPVQITIDNLTLYEYFFYLNEYVKDMEKQQPKNGRS